MKTQNKCTVFCHMSVISKYSSKPFEADSFCRNLIQWSYSEQQHISSFHVQFCSFLYYFFEWKLFYFLNFKGIFRWTTLHERLFSITIQKWNWRDVSRNVLQKRAMLRFAKQVDVSKNIRSFNFLFSICISLFSDFNNT